MHLLVAGFLPVGDILDAVHTVQQVHHLLGAAGDEDIIILGAHIGTAFTPLLTIGGSSKDGKRAALIHLYFNIIGSFVLLGAIYAVRYTIGIPVWGDVMNKSTIANIHTLSSVAAMLLFLPFSSVLSKLAMLTVPNSAEEAQELSMPVLDERLFKSPAVALQQAKSAVIKMSRRAARNVNLAAPLLLKMDEDIFLDDFTLKEVSDTLQVPIDIVKSSGYDFTESLLGKF